MDQKVIDVRALAAKFLNFIQQNWLTITLMAVLSGLLIRVVQTGLRQPFDPTAVVIAIAISVAIAIAITVDSINTGTNVVASLGFIAIAGISAALVIVNAITGIIMSIIFIIVIVFNIIIFGVIGRYFWNKKRKYYPPFLLMTIIISVTIIFSCLKPPRGMELYERKSGKHTPSTVFLALGSGTLEEKYFVVKRIPQKEISVYIWVPAIENAGWSGDRKLNSLRKKIFMTYNLKNYKAYKRIHGTKIPEIPLTAPSRAQAPEAFRKAFLWQVGLTDKDIEIIKIDGLEGSMSKLDEQKLKEYTPCITVNEVKKQQWAS